MIPGVLLQSTQTGCGMDATKRFKWPCGLLVRSGTRTLIVTSLTLKSPILAVTKDALAKQLLKQYAEMQGRDKRYFNAYEANGITTSASNLVASMGLAFCDLSAQENHALSEALAPIREALPDGGSLSAFRAY